VLLLPERNACIMAANLREWHQAVVTVSAEGDQGPLAEERTHDFEPTALPPQP